MIYLVLILATVISGSLFFLIRKDFQRQLKFLLAFSGAFLIGITFLSLVPEVFSHPDELTGLFVLAGFLLQVALELITEGAEHGHKHQHRDNEVVSPFLLLSGLCIHAFLEGMPITGEPSSHIEHTLIYGIIVHNIPISLTLVGLFLHYGCSRVTTLLYLTLFAIMTPLGAWVSHLIDQTMVASMDQYFHYILAVVIGIFLHVSTSILFETEENHRYNVRKFITVCAGLLIAFLISHQH
jgi:zinc transporter ZupT